MNDDNTNDVNAEKSLCWKCQYGICVKESETERVYHANMRGLPGGGGIPGQEQFGIFDEMPFKDGDNEEDPELIEHTIEHERIKTICFWKPEGTGASPPILVSKVDQCSRFEEK